MGVAPDHIIQAFEIARKDETIVSIVHNKGYLKSPDFLTLKNLLKSTLDLNQQMHFYAGEKESVYFNGIQVSIVPESDF